MVQLSDAGDWSGLNRESPTDLFAAATPRRLKTGELLFEAGDSGDGCYRLERGLLKVSLTSSEDNERIVAVLSPGAIVGDLAMIDGLPRSASVIALSDCELRFISKQAFERYARQHPDIYRYLAMVLAARLRRCDQNIGDLAFSPVKTRVARALLSLAETLGQGTDSGRILIPRITQGDIAAMAGLARETTNRVLTDWERTKLVTKSSGSYQIDAPKLRGELVQK